MRVAAYVGSFDPVHKGHIEIVNQIIREDKADMVFVIATSDYWNKHINLSLKQRMALLKIFASDRIKVLSDRVRNKPRQYTYELLDAIKKEYLDEDDELMLVMGADNIVKFDEWKNYQTLLDKYPFILIRRNGIDIAEYMKRYGKKDYHILNLEPMDISSTYIRENLDDFEKIKDMIDERVYKRLMKYRKG